MKENIFQINHSEIKKKSIRGGGITLATKSITFFIQIISTIILARILTPTDYGIMAMVVAVTGFAAIFSNLGLSTATVQKKEITHNEVSALFWINSLLGLGTTIVVASSAPIVAWFYNEPILLWVVLALSVNFFFSGLSVQHFAILNRLMEFSKISTIEIISMVFALGAAFWAAQSGFGYWSLVLNNIVFSIVKTLGAWFATGWVPSLLRPGSDIKSLVKFGSDVAGFNVINYFARNLDNILIGRFHGGFELGIYGKAYQLLMMPITNLRDPLMSVAMPALSQMQNEPDRYRSYYLKCVSVLSFLSMPAVMFMFVCSDQLVYLILGPQWIKAGEIFKILALVALIQPIVGTVGMVMLSKGRSRNYLKLGILNAVVVSISFIIGIPWGGKGVAFAYAVANYIMFLPTMRYGLSGSSIKIFDFLNTVKNSLFSSLVMGCFCYLMLRNLNQFDGSLMLSICFLTCSTIYVFIHALTTDGRQNISLFFKCLNLAARRV